MGLQSALTTALTGMRAAETSIDVVGNNVANSQTVGFKESTVNFATQFLQTQSIGAAPSDASGGTNPRQTGLGVKVAEITPIFTQGTIEISSNPLDVAIQGEGFLIVQGGQGGQFYTRNGQLKTNENNEVTTVTGQRVLGFNAVDGNIIEDLQPLRIPIGETAVAQPTQNVFLNGTLVPTVEVGDTPQIIQSSILATSEFEVPDDSGFTISNIKPAATPNITGITPTFPAGASHVAGDYSYRAVFVDDAGNEGTISTAFTVTSPGANGITLDGLQTAAPPYANINIYRTAVGGTGSYYLLGAATDPTGTPTFTDTIDDATLVGLTTLDESSVGPDPYSYYVTFVDSGGQTAESRPTKQVGTVSTQGGRIRLDSIPQPTLGGDYNQIRIYRNTGADSSTFYEVATFAANTATSDVYMDSRSDTLITGTGNTLDFDGPKINQATLLTDIQLRNNQDFTSLFQLGELSYSGKKGDRTLEAKTFDITATSTVQELLAFVDQASGFDTSVTSTASSTVLGGRLQIASNVGEENAINIGLSSFQMTPSSTGLTEPISIPFTTLQDANGEGTTTDMVVYDSLGIPLTVRVTTVLESKNGTSTVYRWFATSPDNEPVTGTTTSVGTGVLTFDGNGDLVESNSNSSVAVQRNTTASQSPLVFDLDFSQVSGLADQNNLGEAKSNLNLVRQDGFPPGVLTSFAVTETGEIRGVFSNGIETTLAQIRMARFTNNAGLQQAGNNLFSKGVNSGEPQLGDPGQNGLGALTAGAVELSNTDIGQNLIELILASTQYRGGARVISAVQELLDELLALRR